ncbi:NAC domain-containing protein 41-like [Corylus avellana]|uniref:NAC domain-containing protein 41-like n=1 Tax=Corylus avellana TaxID=13451 RepID=UPI001E233E1F|nr:NAC domain-containing protein 41-like [Corylus avellana]XP_059432121.1 NAC domain-containing protein 41-like [Corylus avellana]
MMMMPVGFRFEPTDEELVGFYLLNKVRGEDLGWDGIGEFDIYGETAPWQFCGDQEKLYVFTRLKNLSKNRVARTAGCGGVWHENSSDKIYDAQGDVIGARKLFSFKVKEGSCMKKSNWIMHEFSLVGEGERTTDWVLCTIQKKESGSRAGVKRCFQDQSSPTIISVDTPSPCYKEEEVLLLEDGSQQRKKMRCDVKCDGPQATGTPSECPSEFGTPESEFTPSQNSVDIVEESNTQKTDLETLTATDNSDSEFSVSYEYLETLMSCQLADDSASEFYASYGYLPPPPSPVGGHLPLDAWVDSWDPEFGTCLVRDNLSAAFCSTRVLKDHVKDDTSTL